MLYVYDLEFEENFKKIHRMINISLWTTNFPTGFDGKKCEKLTTLNFNNDDSYIRVPNLNNSPGANVTVVFATKQNQGTLLVPVRAKNYVSNIRLPWNITIDL